MRAMSGNTAPATPPIPQNGTVPPRPIPHAARRPREIEEQRRALKARLTKQERARDTRRKVLLGAFLLHQLDAKRDAAGPLAALLARGLAGFLQREDDKAVLADLIASKN